MISFSQVYKNHPGGHEALKSLSFTAEPGEAAKDCFTTAADGKPYRTKRYSLIG